MNAQPGADELRIRSILRKLGVGPDAPPPLPPLPAGGSKTALILAASSMLHPGASAADIAHHLAQHGHAVDTAYVRTVLSRSKKPGPDDGVGKGGGGYA